MIRYVCSRCKVHMRCKKNGIVVGYVSSKRFEADLWECPECENEIAITAREALPFKPLNGKEVEADIVMREDQ